MAVNKEQAIVEFRLDGTIESANDNYLRMVGYSMDEIRGKHHSMLVDSALRDSKEYRRFWERLGQGQFDVGQYLRIGKSGRHVWIQASFNPIMDAHGRPFKVVKYAHDVTDHVSFTKQRGETSREAADVGYPRLFSLPEPARVGSLFRLLFAGSTVRLGVQFDLTNDATSFVGVYVDEYAVPVAACACDLAFAAGCGAALSMLRPKVVTHAINTKNLTPRMTSNLTDIVNACIGLLFNRNTPRLKLRGVCTRAELPTDAVLLMNKPGQRVDYSIRLPEYGIGALALMSI